MPNTLDQRTLAQENWSLLDPAIASGFISGNFDQVGPTLNLTATAGAGLGTSPPATIVTPGANAFRGNITFGTGTSPPAGGLTLTVVFPFALTGLLRSGTVTPQAYIFLSATTQATAAFGFAAVFTTTGQTVTGFTVSSAGTLGTSQGNTVYGLNYWLIG